MNLKNLLVAPLLAPLWGLALVPASPAQEIGTRVETVELDDWSQTEATSYDDLLGRTVLIEFFAYW